MKKLTQRLRVYLKGFPYRSIYFTLDDRAYCITFRIGICKGIYDVKYSVGGATNRLLPIQPITNLESSPGFLARVKELLKNVLSCGY